VSAVVSAQPRLTPLHSRHVALGARMIDFGGWDMPVYYSGINDEHQAVRTAAGVFDVSHMGQLDVTGRDAHAYLQSRLSNDLDRIGEGYAQYTLLTTEDGGITDDLIAYRRGPGDYLLVVNAANTDVDYAALNGPAPSSVDVSDVSASYGMIALQGPAYAEVLGTAMGRGAAAIAAAAPFTFLESEIAGAYCTFARTGYTGEPGVEIITPAAATGDVWDALLLSGATPCGLGARDTLRLEVCYPLHGNDISTETDAISAGLGWVCAQDKEFTGSDTLRRIRAAGPAQRLVAFVMTERAIPRAGMDILDDGDSSIGRVTSGTLSPSLDEGIGMGYVPAGRADAGTEIVVDVRGRHRPGVVKPKPLYRKEP
jgi:aminomethyltransferase